ncbi:MAG: EamA family transporter, partial [Clostridia bacterium]|nr:EamA family transporter [Clostridia bacterium]
SMGLFVKSLAALGLSSLSITAFRLTSASAVMILVFLIFDRSKLKIKLCDLGWFVAAAIFSVVAMSVLYFTSINATSMAVAAILLYTAPIFVMLMSCLLFREKLTTKKICALVLAFAGCVLVAGMAGNVTAFGILTGLGSGFAYALYSIFGVVLLKRYHPFTVTIYTFTIAGMVALLISNPTKQFPVLLTGGTGAVVTALAMGVVTAAIPYLLYTLGLRDMEASRASVIATSEPMVAAVLGILVYHEEVTLSKLLGIFLILGAILLLNVREKNQKTESC